MSEITEIGHKPVALARTLGPGSIILLGIGALLGGGIFTLLGPAAGLAGPGLFLSMLLGAILALLNLQMYIALGTTFPEAGGGYLWVRKGLGDFQGFLAGWLSWFAHGAAAGLYALSFGYYAYETYKLFGGELAVNILSIEKIAGAAVVIIFGYINWKGARESRATGNIVDGILVGILIFFIGSGAFKIFSEPAQSFSQYSPLLPNGFLGVLSAAALFYIAFEGSEIQVQTGEETKDPKKTLKTGLFWSWAIVSSLYVLVSLVIIGATRNGDPAWKVLGQWGEGAIVKSAQGFMPLGTFLMLIGGLLANLGALNATIYSCSRVAFALARDKNVWSHLADIHLKNLSPHLAVIFSTVLIALMVIFIPLLDVAALASLLFILLFLQLNIAGIKIHYKWPNTQWAYKVPLFPLLPLIAIAAYALLALTMLKINLNAWIISAFWLLLGLINYLSYAKTQGREDFEKEIVYEESVRVGPKTGRRILMPIAPELTLEELKNLSEIAFALASNLGGEIIAVKIHEIPQPLTLLDGATMTHDRQIFQNLKEWVTEFNAKNPNREKDVNLHNLLLVGRDIVETILDVIKMEDCDLLILNWEGYTKTKGTILGSKIDRILRESKCDLLVVKNPRPITSLMLAIHPAGDSPYLKLMGELFTALRNYYNPKTELASILAADTPFYLKPDPQILLKPLGLKRKDFDEVEFFKAKSVVTALIDETKTKEVNLVIIGASRPKILGEIRFGSIPELLAKHLHTSLMIVRGHQGIAEALLDKLISRGASKAEKE